MTETPNPKPRMLNLLFRTAFMLALLISAPTLSHAQSKERPVGADLEVDPTAFALGGYSLHAGIAHQQYRFDVGAYAMELPAFFVGNSRLEAEFHGFGVKVQRFFRPDQSGGFVGAGAGLSKVLFRHKATLVGRQQLEFGAGVNLGWRFALPAGFYVTPWLGVDYNFMNAPFTVGGERVARHAVSPFPAAHLGYRFQ